MVGARSFDAEPAATVAVSQVHAVAAGSGSNDRSGQHQRECASQIASSTEYYGLHVSNDTQFIQGLHQNLLGRNASDTEVQTWLNEINTAKHMRK